MANHPPTSEPVPPVADASGGADAVHDVKLGTQTPQAVGVAMAVSRASIDVSIHEEAQAADQYTATLTRFALPPDLNGDILQIANDLRTMVPLLQQLVDAQARLGGNVGASVGRLSPDSPRIAELTATILDEEARSDQPRMHVVEQCLRVGRLLLLTAMKVMASVILTIDGTLSYEALTDPDQAQRHAQNIVTTIEHVLTKLL